MQQIDYPNVLDNEGLDSEGICLCAVCCVAGWHSHECLVSASSLMGSDLTRAGKVIIDSHQIPNMA